MPIAIGRPSVALALKDFDPERSRAEITRFRKMTLPMAIREAATCRMEDGEPCPHQWKNWNMYPDAIPAAVPIITQAEPRFRKCDDFDAFHDLITELVRDIRGLGLLYCYDVAFRIASSRGDDYLPKKVYLHAGSLNGARIVLPNRSLKKGDVLEMSELPAALQKYEPWAVEDFLCHYAKLCGPVKKRPK